MDVPARRANAATTVPRTILILDSRQEVGALVEAVLRGAEYAVTTATDSQAVLAAWEIARCDLLVIVDQPGAAPSGPGFVRQLRGRGETLPIVLIRAQACALALPQVAVLVMPFAVAELRAVVRQVLAADASAVT